MSCQTECVVQGVPKVLLHLLEAILGRQLQLHAVNTFSEFFLWRICYRQCLRFPTTTGSERSEAANRGNAIVSVTKSLLHETWEELDHRTDVCRVTMAWRKVGGSV